MARALQRRPRRGPRTFQTQESVLLICEGQRTEPGYFKALKNIFRIRSYALEFSAPADPNSIAAEALEKREIYDHVWAVFDCDRHPGIEQVKNRCRQAGVKVAFSNPCFELWLILHVQDMDRVLNHNQVQALCRKLLPYPKDKKKVLDFHWLLTEYPVKVAEKRAHIQLQRRMTDRNPEGNPSTSVGELTKFLRP